VLSFLAETGDDTHVQNLRRHAQAHAMEMTSQSHTDEAALFDDDDDEALAEAKRKVFSGEDAKDSVQRSRSFQRQPLTFDNTTRTAAGHHIMTVKALAVSSAVLASLQSITHALSLTDAARHHHCRHHALAARAQGLRRQPVGADERAGGRMSTRKHQTTQPAAALRRRPSYSSLTTCYSTSDPSVYIMRAAPPHTERVRGSATFTKRDQSEKRRG